MKSRISLQVSSTFRSVELELIGEGFILEEIKIGKCQSSVQSSPVRRGVQVCKRAKVVSSGRVGVCRLNVVPVHQVAAREALLGSSLLASWAGKQQAGFYAGIRKSSVFLQGVMQLSIWRRWTSGIDLLGSRAPGGCPMHSNGYVVDKCFVRDEVRLN
nr:hypothetical protein Iba_chr02aCG3100 [Ipomoea batatas]